MNYKKLKRIVLRITLGVVLLLTVLTGLAFLLISIYSSEIRNNIHDKVRDQFSLELRIEKVQLSLFSNWPHATIALKNVKVSSILYTGPKENFLNAGAIYLSFNLRKLMHGQISIKQVSLKNARIVLRKLKDGSRNFEMKKQQTDTSTASGGLNLETEKVVVRNTELVFVNEQKKQRFHLNLINVLASLRHQEEGFQAKVNAEVYVGGLVFKSNKGAFFRNSNVKLQLDLMHDKVNKRLCVHPPSKVEIEKRFYNVMCLLNYQEDPMLFIGISAQEADLVKVSKVLNPKIQKVLNNFHVSKPLKANVLLGMTLGQGREPIVLLKAQTLNNSMTIGNSKVPYSNLSFEASIVSLSSDRKSGDGDSAMIRFSRVSGNVYDFPFTTSVLVKGLRDSKIFIEAGVKIPAEKVHFDFARKLNLKGECIVHIKYLGPANKLNKSQFLSENMKLQAQLWLKNLYFQPKENPYFFRLNGTAWLNNKQLSFKKLDVYTNGGKLSVSGQVDNFIPYFLGLKPGLRSKLDISSRFFDFGTYMQANAQKSHVVSARKKMEQKAMMKDDDFVVQLNFNAEHFSLKKLKAQSTSIRAEYTRQVLYLNTIQMALSGGTLKARAKLDHWEHLSSDIDINNVDISDLFKQADNFGQKSINPENISGKLFLKGNFNARLDENKQLVGESLRSDISLKLIDGHLLNFEPMQNISKHIFRNRDFKDIAFSEINETFILKGQSMKIEEMELASNVMNMYVSGVYSFNNLSCINLLIPWNNLRHRGKDYVVKTSGVSAEDTKGVRLYFEGPPGKMKLMMGRCSPVF
ncbi:MAG TPA: AsmA family protein [Bacteroidia bacterium]|nr:AsmA family protein [Bacteroidia bacterium]